MQQVEIGGRKVSRLILGSNPFSGFSHQGVDRDAEMVHYYSVANIKRDFRRAEEAGINTVIARGDHHVLRLMREYWDEGGKIQWFCQTCPEVGPPGRTIANAAKIGAPAVHIHGGYADSHVARGEFQPLVDAVACARDHGLAVGLAGHQVATIRWAADNLDLDYFMTSYYNPIPRTGSGEHKHGAAETYVEEDRAAMTAVIATLPAPAIHYKVMAAGRNDPAEAFAYVAQHLRPGDACCVGVFTADNQDMIAEDAEIFQAALEQGAPV